MKKLLVITLAVLMLLPLNLLAFANSDTVYSVSVYTGNSTKTYNPDREINVTLSLRDIAFGSSDGISAFEFDIFYDKNMLTPVTTAATDSDGDAGDFSKLMSVNPGSWEGFGVLDTKAGKYNLAFSDTSGSGSITQDDSLVIKIPFRVNAAARVNDIVFNFDNVAAYNKDMSSKIEIEVDSVVISYAVQPAVNKSLPNEYVSLDVAGYRHDAVNFVYYASKATTVGNFVSRYCSTNYNQDRLSTFAILIADLDGVISYVDTTVGTSSNKSSVKIPAGSYIIGVSSSNAEDLEYMKTYAKVGQQVTIYNVNIEATGKYNTATSLIRAAFIIDEEGVNPPFIGGNDPDEEIVPPDPGIQKPPSEDDPTNNPGTTEDNYVKGDINNNGSVDMTDYILAKRAYFGTYKLDSGELKRGDVNESGNMDMTDYILIKRVYFGTYSF